MDNYNQLIFICNESQNTNGTICRPFYEWVLGLHNLNIYQYLIEMHAHKMFVK